MLIILPLSIIVVFNKDTKNSLLNNSMLVNNVEASVNNVNIEENKIANNIVIIQQSSGNIIKPIEINNQDIKKLYSIVKFDGSNYPNYIKFELNDMKMFMLLSIIAKNYAETKSMTAEMLDKYSNGYISNTQYAEKSKVLEGMKKVLNIDSNEIDLENIDGKYICLYYKYNKVIDQFVYLTACGGLYPKSYETVYKYEEKDKEIYLYSVVAISNIYGDRIISRDQQKIYDTNNFNFTDENFNDFYYLKYTFSQNENGNYYVKNVEEV